MSDTVDARLVTLSTEIDKLADDLARDRGTVGDALTKLRDLLIELKVRVDTMGTPKPPDLTPVVSSLEAISKKTDGIDQRVPPLPAMYAAALIVLAFFGFSWKNLSDLRAPVEKAARTLEESASSMTSAAKEVRDASGTIVTGAQTSEREQRVLLDQFKTNIGGLDTQFRALASQVGGFEKTFARLISDAEIIRNSIAKLPGAEPKRDEIQDNSEQEWGLVVNAFGEDFGPYTSLYLEARRDLTHRDFEEARRKALKAKESDPDLKDASYDVLIAGSYIAQEKWREAIAYFDMALDRDPKSGSAHRGRSIAYHGLAKGENDPNQKKDLLEKSVQDCRDATEADPESPVPIVNMTISLNELGRYAESIEALDGWKGKPTPELLRQKAATYALMDQVAPALTAVGEAIELDRAIALRIAADNDFAKLRSNADFQNLLEAGMGPRLMGVMKRTWNSTDTTNAKPE